MIGWPPLAPSARSRTSATAKANRDGLQFHNPKIVRGPVFLFSPSSTAADGDSKVVRLKGLDRKATYALAFQDGVALNCSRTGAQLMDEGVTVSGMVGDRAREIIWIEGPAARRMPPDSR